MQITLIRHAQDPDGYRGGWSTLGLTDEGHAQARALAERLGTSALGQVICSDLPRAQQTAQLLAERLSMALEPDPQWREMNNGELAGLPHATAEARYPGLYFDRLRMDQRYPAGESPLEFQERIHAAWARLTARMEAQSLPNRVALVTHGGVIGVLLHHLRGLEWTNACKVSVPHVGVIQVQWREGAWELEFPDG